MPKNLGADGPADQSARAFVAGIEPAGMTMAGIERRLRVRPERAPVSRGEASGAVVRGRDQLSRSGQPRRYGRRPRKVQLYGAVQVRCGGRSIDAAASAMSCHASAESVSPCCEARASWRRRWGGTASRPRRLM